MLLSLAGACVSGEEEGEDEASDEGAANDQCLSGEAWVGGNAESPRMHPGRDCLGCHSDLGEAEEVKLGGTVYDGSNELDDCYGVEGVTLQITDSTSKVTELTSNAAGNFVLLAENGSITPPYSAKLIYEGRERMMVTMQTELSCNSCHTETGTNGAPGRILAP
ncbi:hypothetical protein ACNOYE_25865 [Nannocystaceae bacterium ST9]